MTTKPTPPFVDIGFYDPAPGDACERGVGKKIKRRWAVGPCGRPAASVVRWTPSGGARFEIKLCRACLAAYAREFVSILVYEDPPAISKKREAADGPAR